MEVTINGVVYRAVDATGERVAIVVLDRGFVVVGRVSHDGDWVVIRNCSCIRKWGTTRGLGEIASGGPTSNTVLDAQPTTRVHQLQVVQIIDAEAGKWNL